MGYVQAQRARRRARRALQPGALGDVDNAITSAIPGVFPASAEQWRNDLAAAAPDIPTNFLIAWLTTESGGNPCSTGIPGREAGIWQTMSPGDDRFGATFAQLRQGCNGQQVVNPGAVDHAAQMSGLNMVREYVAIVSNALAANGVPWDPSSSDFWKAVKSYHGLPCIMSDLLPRVVAAGGPPNSWDDFHDRAMAMAPGDMGQGCGGFAMSQSTSGLINRLDDVFANASKVGKWGGGVLASLPVGGAAGRVMVVGSALLLLYMVWKRRQRPRGT